MSHDKSGDLCNIATDTLAVTVTEK